MAGGIQTRIQKRDQKGGLVFSVNSIFRRLAKGRFSNRISISAAVGIAATIEYLTVEILDLAGINAEKDGRKIEPRHIQLAIRNDEELTQMCANMQITQGSVKENIREFFINQQDIDQIQEESESDES